MPVNMDSISAKLQALAKKLEENVSIRRLFPEDFVQMHSNASDIKDLLYPAGVIDQQSYEEWSDNSPDDYIRNRTDFHSWNDMLRTAASQYMSEKKDAIREGTWIQSSDDIEEPFDNIFFHIHF